MKVLRARAWRAGPATFDIPDSASSVSGPKGWRFNDLAAEILYAAEVEALATLEVKVRPAWETMQQVLIATIEMPDGSLVNPADLGITLPGNWASRPVADDSRMIARELLEAVARLPGGVPRPAGLRVPSLLSATDCNILLDSSRKNEYSARIMNRIPFRTFRATAS